FKRRRRVEAFVFHPESRDTDLARQPGKLLQRRQSLAERDWRFSLLERENSGVSPHIPALGHSLTRRHWRIITNEEWLCADRTYGRARVTRFAGVASGTFEVPGAHERSVGVVAATASTTVGDAGGASGAVLRSFSRIRSAVFCPKPRNAAIASGVASRTPCKLPKAASNSRRFDSPTP